GSSAGYGPGPTRSGPGTRRWWCKRGTELGSQEAQTITLRRFPLRDERGTVMQQLRELVAFMAEHDEKPPRKSLPTGGPARSPLVALPGPLGAPHAAFNADPAAQVRWAQKVAHEVNNQLTLMLNRTQSVLRRGGTEG